MSQAIYLFPDHWVEAEKLSKQIQLPALSPEKIVILGMGGSAIGGDMLQVFAEKHTSIPVHVIRNEEIPKYIDEKTFVIAVSYSGNTRETLSAVKQLLNQNKAKLFVISTGGELKELASSKKIPYLEIPGGLMPRAALAFTFVPLLFILGQLAGIPLSLAETISTLKTMRDILSSSSAENPARRLAKALHGKIPVIYAPSPWFAPAARRWKCQINENAKQPAYYEVFPETTHNDIVGFTQPLAIHPFLAAVFLRAGDESPVIKKRIEWTKQTIRKTGAGVYEVAGQGKDFLTQLFSLAYFSDFVSLYLADENGVDPTPIEVINELKEEMKVVH